MSKDISKIANDVSIKLMDIQDHIKALSLISKYQVYYSQNEDNLIDDIKENAVKAKEESEVKSIFLEKSLNTILDNFNIQTQILQDL